MYMIDIIAHNIVKLHVYKYTVIYSVVCSSCISYS